MEYLFSCLVLANLSCTVFGKLSLFNIVEFFQAANYLNIKSLLDLTCQTVADMIKGKTPEEIRKTLTSRMTSPLRKRKRFVGRISGHLNEYWLIICGVELVFL